MNDRYYLLVSEYASRDQAYVLLAAFGIGVVFLAAALSWLGRSNPIYKKIYRAYLGGCTALYILALIAIPILNFVKG